MKTTVIGMLVSALCLCGGMAQTNQAPTGAGAKAMQQAAEGKQYLFAFVYEKDDEATRSARKAFETAVAKVTAAKWVVVDRTAPGEKALVEKYGLRSAPMPLVLAIAPNGAITGAIKASELSPSRLQDAVATPCLQQCLKALQDGQLVVLCLQNAKTQDNEAATKGVKEIKADGWFSETTEVIQVDPSDPKEAKLMTQLKIEPKTKKAVTAVLAPPGMLVAKFEGATTKEGLKAAFKKAAEGCAPGSGCCPSVK
jgi:hypothetical protein